MLLNSRLVEKTSASQVFQENLRFGIHYAKQCTIATQAYLCPISNMPGGVGVDEGRRGALSTCPAPRRNAQLSYFVRVRVVHLWSLLPPVALASHGKPTAGSSC
jgi:hypothetical protein